VCFRGGCLTGPSHDGARLHGFLSYVMRCTATGEPNTVYGYAGKQVRANVHRTDVVAAFDAFRRSPRSAAVYNLGGGRECSCSMLEAIALYERIAGRKLEWALSEHARVGDHRWWISDLSDFRGDYPGWSITFGLETTLREIYERNAERWDGLHGGIAGSRSSG
jgi:CDP-paratose 2-epimerase